MNIQLATADLRGVYEVYSEKTNCEWRDNEKKWVKGKKATSNRGAPPILGAMHKQHGSVGYSACTDARLSLTGFTAVGLAIMFLIRGSVVVILCLVWYPLRSDI